MKLTHWTDKELKEKMIKGEGEFRPLLKDFNFKPIGFWLSIDGSWERWLKGNWDEWLEGKVCLSVELAKNINLFIIESKKQFLKEFKNLTGKDYLKLSIEKFMLHNFHEKLAKKYDGIWLKSKPFWEHRMDLMYFYPWDCESICIWNKEKIKFKEIEK